MLKRLTFETREEWLEGRSIGIGASEAAAAIGMSPWQTTLDLWKLKTGNAQPKDLSGNAAVSQGVKWEPERLAEFSKKKYGKTLCAACMTATNEG